MDRNFVIGLVLIFLIVVGWQFWFSPKPEPEATQAAAVSPRTATPAATPPADSTARVTIQQAPDSSNQAAALAGKLGSFATVATGDDQVIRVTTDKLVLDVHTRGGSLQPVTLRGFNTYQGEAYPVVPSGAENGFQVQFVHNNKVISTRDLVFRPVTPVSQVTVSGTQTHQLVLRAQVAPGQHLDQVYTFRGDRFDVGYRIASQGLSGLIPDRRMELQWTWLVPRTEKNATDQRNKTSVHYFYGGGEGKLDPADSDAQEETLSGDIKWISLRTQFFAAAVLATKDQRLESATVTSAWQEDVDQKVKYLTARIDLDVDYGTGTGAGKPTDLNLYFGPTDFDLMKSYGNDFEQQIDLGWGFIRWINYAVLFVFRQLEKVTLNYGIIILCLALFIKIVLLPLTWRSYLGNAKMQIVNNMPEVKEIDTKYADDPTKAMTMKQAFYATAGVSPFAGCIPLLLQLPILLAMFSFFPQSIELRGASFLWADDLSTYDELIKFQFSIPGLGRHISGFAVLMTVSQLVYTWISQRGQTMTGPAAQMKFLGYVFPIVFFFVLNNYSAGLSYYYFCINALTIIQTFIIKALIDEQKLHDQIVAIRKERTKGGTAAPKPGRMALWLQEQQKKAEQLQRERNQPAAKGKKK